MRLAEIEFLEGKDFVWNKEEHIPLIQQAIFWGKRDIGWNDEKNYPYSWYEYFVDLYKLPPVPHKVNKYLSQNLDSLQEQAKRVPAFNERVQVVVPGLGLMLIDEVEIKEDFCTHELQRQLEAGWRILAICPQPNQRRPDYVLGRVNKKESY